MRNRMIEPFQMVLFSIIFLYCVFVSIKNPLFFHIETIFDLIRVSSSTMIVAMGLFVVMLSGGIDVSFMAIALFGSYTTITAMIALGIDNIFFAFCLSACIGGILGSVNALLIHFLKLPPFIVTLGTQNLFNGLMAIVVGDKSYGAGVLPTCLHDFGQATIGSIGEIGLTISMIPVMIIGGVTWLILYKTLIGRGIFALGNDEEAARRIGFHILKTRLFVYVYSGILAGIMGILYVAQTNALYPNKLVGNELIVIAAVVIGGVKITGGQGKLLGVFLGVLIIQLLNTTLIMVGLSSSWNNLFIGTILVLSVAVVSFQERMRNKKDLIFTD